MKTFRVIAYIDGFNLYFGLRRAGLRSCYWLDLSKLAASLLQPEQTLVGTRYFTARISGPEDKRKRQTDYLDALAAHCDIDIIEGHFQRSARRCGLCNGIERGPSEKRTDVNIASRMIEDAVLDRCDTLLLISADSDLVPAIETVRRLRPEKRTVVAFPPHSGSKHLAAASHVRFKIWPEIPPKCLMPTMITTQVGVEIRCPDHWAPSE